MRFIIGFFLFLLILAVSCNRNEDCRMVTITRNGTICSTWGIKLDGQVYPSNDIPPTFQTEGLIACAAFELYEDIRLCPCCGGTWARIHSITMPEE